MGGMDGAGAAGGVAGGVGGGRDGDGTRPPKQQPRVTLLEVGQQSPSSAVQSV